MTALIYVVTIALSVGVALLILRLEKRRSSRRPQAPWVPPAGAHGIPRAPSPPADVARVRELLASHRRTTYLPLLEDGEGAAASSKFSGAPNLAPGEEWPPCGNCGRPMQLFVQLAADEVPPPARDRIGAGRLLQLFYCTDHDCEDMCEAYAPHAASTLVRIVPAHPGAPAPAVPEGMYDARRIVGWREDDDYPDWEERRALGVDVGEIEPEELPGLDTRYGEKLLGWPLWVQAMEYPDCRICGRRMEMLFQMDSQQSLPWMFGDLGTGHVTQCPEHREELAFGWACT